MGFVRRTVIMLSLLVAMVWLVHHLTSDVSQTNKTRGDNEDSPMQEVEPNSALSDAEWNTIKNEDAGDWEQVGGEEHHWQEIDDEGEDWDAVEDEDEDLLADLDEEEEFENEKEFEETIEEIERKQEEDFLKNTEDEEDDEDWLVNGDTKEADDDWSDNDDDDVNQEEEQWLEEQEELIEQEEQDAAAAQEKEEIADFANRLAEEEDAELEEERRKEEGLVAQLEIETMEQEMEKELEEEKLIQDKIDREFDKGFEEAIDDEDDTEDLETIRREQQLLKVEEELEKEETDKTNSDEEWIKEVEEEEMKERGEFEEIEDDEFEEELRRNAKENEISQTNKKTLDLRKGTGPSDALNVRKIENIQIPNVDLISKQKSKSKDSKTKSDALFWKIPQHGRTIDDDMYENNDKSMDHSEDSSDCDRLGTQLTPKKLPEEWLNKKQWLRQIAESGLLPVEQSLRSLSLVLLAASKLTTGPMLEFGYGVYSTPVLARIGRQQHRYVMSTGTDQERLDRFQVQFNWKCHDFVYINEDKPSSWEMIGNDAKWSVVVVHKNPQERRTEDLIRMAHKAEVLIAPDFPSGGARNFEHVFRWELVQPSVTVMSNTRPDVVKGISEMLTWIEEVFCEDRQRGECLW